MGAAGCAVFSSAYGAVPPSGTWPCASPFGPFVQFIGAASIPAASAAASAAAILAASAAASASDDLQIQGSGEVIDSFFVQVTRKESESPFDCLCAYGCRMAWMQPRSAPRTEASMARFKHWWMVGVMHYLVHGIWPKQKDANPDYIRQGNTYRRNVTPLLKSLSDCESARLAVVLAVELEKIDSAYTMRKWISVGRSERAQKRWRSQTRRQEPAV